MTGSSSDKDRVAKAHAQAHCSLAHFALTCMHVLLLMDHIASPCAVHTVYAQLLQALG